MSILRSLFRSAFGFQFGELGLVLKSRIIQLMSLMLTEPSLLISASR